MLLFNNKNISNVHFIGIGGISMSGIAEILINYGYKVTGSDMRNSSLINRLIKKGANISIGHDSKNISNSDLVIYTSAIPVNNPELIEAKKKNIPLFDRASFLGHLMKQYKESIAIAGTHGKTTTTSMVATILQNTKHDATMLLGGELDLINGNVKIGSKDLLLTEACEYKENFLKFFPTLAVILNIEEDHLDYFKNIDEIKNSFINFANIVPSNGMLIINNDDEVCKEIIQNCECKVSTFGINSKCNYYAENIVFDNDGYPSFNLIINNEATYNLKLNVVGIHNIYNSLAAIAVSHQAGSSMENIIKGIKKFRGTHRRFEIKGTVNGIKVIDDYAHHPTEIKTTLDSIKNLNYNKLWCVFQSHTYTRTKALLEEFGHSFYNADEVIITDIYAAREKNTGLVTANDLALKIKENNENTQYIGSFDKIASYLLDNAQPGDIIITMGAGDVYKIGEKLLK